MKTLDEEEKIAILNAGTAYLSVLDNSDAPEWYFKEEQKYILNREKELGISSDDYEFNSSDNVYELKKGN